ncbi:Predicted PurR-regulated permease PerM [Carnobacterium iners]|uniref:Predicted PurR-regulated permease PerM n=1 Tax=Carnobacterium iners TaxID=1073423 RepID=A0A1X7NP90_9LACT|nr:AI-2E family transporter [Carnobacterium iners]SEK29235.1 Predicted PurR-regulated permease PerM [Carnobacterium iners]SMH39792.1 Predicted PurR-regulated permease PerM [Carnobacterium iners]
MELFKKSKLMFWSIWLLVVATLIFMSTKIDFIFQPVTTFVSTLFTPILVAGFLYYLLNPIINLMGKTKIKRKYGILIILLLFIGILTVLIFSVLPVLVRQVGEFIANIPDLIKALEAYSREIIRQPWLKDFNIEKSMNELDFSIGNVANTVFLGITNSVGSIFGAVTNTTIVIFTAPIILFYMFKDGQQFRPAVAKFFPKEFRGQLIELLGQMNKTIASYISGQSLVCLMVGILTFIGYLITGMPYALLLGIIAGVTNIIPYVGPYIGAAPAVIIGLTISPTKAILVALVVLVVQQIDGNFISPNVIGKTLDIHPLTIIVILLVAGNLAGLLGMILGVPFYAVVKTIVIYLHDMINIKKRHQSL